MMRDVSEARGFFLQNYRVLQSKHDPMSWMAGDKPGRKRADRLQSQHDPMSWMVRMFEDVIAGRYPRLVDLPTGAGKTQLVVIWLLALAWYGRNRSSGGEAVPRRLVWIVNRRVLVQQVFDLAEELYEKLEKSETGELENVREGLRALSGNGGCFNIVELRGQIIADRDWAVHPELPQLIIGTVDQIGSRLLFQGYGLGKWNRPQQAGLLGVDCWLAVDESHLVPAFVLTLRQLRERCGSSPENLPPPLDAVFARLPFWLTELSATPGLPAPSSQGRFKLSQEEERDEAIADRILAAQSRQVRIEWLPEGQKPKEVLLQKMIEAATNCRLERIAVFVREVWLVDKIAAGIKKAGVPEDHICKITGRIRGYERDRIVTDRRAFKEFRLKRSTNTPVANGQSFYLIGTAAAEVGLDADADVILCDFASVPTLLQRLGRLDRRGFLSRRFVEGKGEPPFMQIFAGQQEVKPKVQKQLPMLAAALNAVNAPYSAELMAGSYWLAPDKKESESETGKEEADKDGKEKSSAQAQIAPLIEAATWNILSPDEGVCKSPKGWLTHELARVAAGPVVSPPVTDAVLDYWSATTDARSPHLSPHPFLYGLAENEEGTPLVGVAFRLEVEGLRMDTDEEDDAEAAAAGSEVVEIFTKFPPLGAELHQLKLSTLREWLESPDAEKHPLVYQRGDKWHAKAAHESGAAAAAELGPNGRLVLPASVLMRESCQELLKDSGSSELNVSMSDVLEGVSKSSRYRRTIEPTDGRTGADGAWLWDADDQNDEAPAVSKPECFEEKLKKELRVGGKQYIFRYYGPQRATRELQYLDDVEGGACGHLARAVEEANRLANVIAPNDGFLGSLLTMAACHHDEGKRFRKWQRAFGWRGGWR